MKILKCDKCGKEYLKILKLSDNHIAVDEPAYNDLSKKESRLRISLDQFINGIGDFCLNCDADLAIELFELTNCVLGENK